MVKINAVPSTTTCLIIYTILFSLASTLLWPGMASLNIRLQCRLGDCGILLSIMRSWVWKAKALLHVNELQMVENYSENPTAASLIAVVLLWDLRLHN